MYLRMIHQLLVTVLALVTNQELTYQLTTNEVK